MEEDAQKQLRKRIIDIQSNASLTPQEKAHQIQKIMGGKHMQARHVEEQKKTLDDGQLDKSLSYDPKSQAEPAFGCQHYRRGAKIMAACCGQLFPCRFCHDERVKDHKINRHDVETMMCYYCGGLQPIGQTCKFCNKQLGLYYCDICKFLDDSPNKQIYHCDECGLCRIGSRGDFFHCKKCSACITCKLQEHHECIEDSMKTDCPVCKEDLFTSRSEVYELKCCKHWIHTSCLNNFSGSLFRCPLCLKTIGDRSLYWSAWDEVVDDQPMPPEWANIDCQAHCFDCGKKNTVKLHFFGLKCPSCGSYNTAKE